MTSGEGQAPPLLTLLQARSRRLERDRALFHAPLQLGVQPLELPGLAVEVDEKPDLGAQQVRHDRYRQVVHRADLVTPQAVEIGHMDRRNEDDSSPLETRVLTDHGRQLEPVKVRHDNVDQDDGNLGAQKVLERLPRRGGTDKVLAQLL
jgi:hypothetical protein